MSNVLESKVVRTIVWVLGGLIVIFLAFGLGMAVGERRAGFDAGFGANYYRNFYGIGVSSGPRAFTMMASPAPIHGVVGTVIDTGSSTISIKDQAGNEQSVVVASGTDIREQDGPADIDGIDVGDGIAVIGEPNSQGQIVARFIRIFPEASSTTQ